MKGNIGLALGLLGLLSSAYFYEQSSAEREPIFRTSNSPSLIASSEHESSSKIRVIDENGEDILGEVWSEKFVFYNNGDIPLKHSEILETLTISLSGDPTPELVDVRISGQSRPNIVEAKLTQNGQKIELSYNIMEDGDYVVGQAIFKGHRGVSFQLDGTLLGVKSISEHPKMEWVRWAALSIAVFCLFCFVVLLIVGVLMGSTYIALPVILVIVPNSWLSKSRKEEIVTKMRIGMKAELDREMRINEYVRMIIQATVVLIAVGWGTYQYLYKDSFLSNQAESGYVSDAWEK